MSVNTGKHPGRRAVSTTSRLWIMTFGLWLCATATPLSAETVTAQTTECNGAMGFASFSINRLYKIQEGPCTDPGDPGKNLKQVLLKSDSGLYQYEVLWVTEEESRAILQQIKEIKTARLKDLSGPDVVVERTIVEKTQVIQESGPDKPSSTETTRSAADPAPDSAPPTIELVDPPIGNTRSSTRIVMPPEAESRALIGKTRAEAGILSLTVNGEEQNINEQGVFKANIPLKAMRTPVSIVAVDQTGRNSTLEFEFVRKSPAKSTSGGEDGDEVFGHYHALIVANNEYEHLMDLATPANDANTVADILDEQYGFDVTMLLNATRYDIVTALNDLRRTLTEKDNLLIYFAGHGAYDKANNRGHWLPVDAEHDNTANWISTIEITDIVNAMTATHVLVVADSCYSGALSRSENTDLDPGMSPELRAEWLRTMAKTKSRHVLTSGGVKPVVDDAGNGHSVFANAFISTLQEGEGAIESSELYRKIDERVANRSRELALDQTPQYAQLKNTGHEFGEFIFVTQHFGLAGQDQPSTTE